MDDFKAHSQRLRPMAPHGPHRKPMKQALRESEEKYRRLFEEDLTGNVVTTPDGRIVACNSAFIKIFGFHSIEEARNTNIIDTFLLQEERLHFLERLKQEGKLENYGSLRRRRDGSIIYAIENAVGHFDASGELVETTGYIYDDSARKQAEEALRENEEKYRTLVEMSPTGILIHQYGKIVYANPIALRILGGSRTEDLLERTISDIFPPDLCVETQNGCHQNLWGGQSPLTEFRIVRIDGAPVWVEGRGTRIDINNQPAILVVFQDITERKQAEEAKVRYVIELKQYAENLKRSNEDLERFAYVSSHDLQEPLRTIVSFTQLLERRYSGQLDPDADEYIGFIVGAGKRMQSLINDLLEYSRVTTKGSEMKMTDSEAVLEAALADLRIKIEETGASIAVDRLPAVIADASQLQQVFVNLISNAITFRREEPPHVHISAQRTGNFVQFSIQDNGIGIEPEYQEKIFVIFQRLHGREKYPGTGIGLAICKRIVERHGGCISLESEPGNGSTFHFTLPAASL
jgi:PAS domain S-box-containing protein